MLAIQKQRARRPILTVLAVVLLAGGAYVLSLVAAPTVAPLLATQSISVSALPAPTETDDRIIIPKIGVNIKFAPGAESLDRGAEWRHPDRGNPVIGGNFIIAAHRFSIQPTPQGTVEKSPFYNIDKLSIGDKIIVDYQGVRYAYEIDKEFDVTPNQTEIEAPSNTAKLTLYSCELGGSDAGRIVITASPMGKVAVGQSSDS